MLLNFEFCNLYVFFFSIDLILLLEHSFTLVQNNSKDPFSLAVQKYQASGTPAQVTKELDGVFDQYSAATNDKERVKLIMDVILHNHIC